MLGGDWSGEEGSAWNQATLVLILLFHHSVWGSEQVQSYHLILAFSLKNEGFASNDAGVPFPIQRSLAPNGRRQQLISGPGFGVHHLETWTMCWKSLELGARGSS